MKKKAKNWLNKRNKEEYFKKSKYLGYRSRSAFKILKMNKKFNFLKKNYSLLDLGSSPGGWSQVSRKEIAGGKILGVDIKEMQKIKNVDFIKGNFCDHDIIKKIMVYFNYKVNIVLSDIAANTTGNKSLDSFKTGELCLKAMDLAKKILRKEGVFISKIFMGSIFSEINSAANKLFKKVVIYKPISSKKESKEIYIYCNGLLKIWYIISMYKKLFIIKILTICFILCSSSIAGTSDNFDRGVKLYDKKDFDNSRILFERDIVFNPKNENSYLYLSKIFNVQNKKDLEEKNLNTVILLDPKNEEAVFSLAKLKLEESDYIESKKMIENLLKFCENYCQKSSELKTQIDKSLKK